MHKNKKKRVLAKSHARWIIGVSLMWVVVPALAIPVGLDAVVGGSRATDGASATNIHSIISTTDLPLSTTLSNTNGNSTAITELNFSGNDNSATFSFDFTHAIDNASNSGGCCFDNAQTVFDFRFTPTVDTTYSFNGFYNAQSPTATRVFMDVSFAELVPLGSLFRDTSDSRTTANESFLVGNSGTDGDTLNTFSGSATGNLLAGHNYNLFFQIFIEASQGNTDLTESFVAATANGNLTLTIGDPTSVPEPAPIFLLGLGLACLRRTQRKNPRMTLTTWLSSASFASR